MNIEIEKQIAMLFLTLSEYESKIELIRQNLAEFEEFEPYAAFQRISRQGKGYISQKEISDFLEFNGMNSYENDLEFLIRVYDSNDDKRLSYRDFLNFILPHSSPELRQICTQRQSYAVNVDEILPWEIEFKLAKLIELEISLFNETDSLKNTAVNLPNFNLKETFSSLSGDNISWIDMSSLAQFLAKLNHHFKEHDLFCIIKRIDKDQDGSICYSDFVEFILPIKPYTRLSLNSMMNKSNINIDQNSPQKTKSNISPNKHLFPAHFKCHSCTNAENIELVQKFQSNIEKNTIEKSSTATVHPYSNNNNSKVRKEMSHSEKMDTYMTNLTYTETNREKDSFRTPTKNLNSGNSKDDFFPTKPLFYANKTQDDKRKIDDRNVIIQKIPEENLERKEKNNMETKIEKNDISHEISNKMRVFDSNKSIKEKFPDVAQKNDKSMTPNSKKSIIVDELKTQIKDLFFLEKSIKLYLEELYSDFDVDLYQIFKFFDITNKEKIDSKCLELKLKENDIFISKFEIYCFVEKYDGENKGFLNAMEFCEAFANKFPFPDKKYSQNGSFLKKPQNFEKKMSKALGIIINFECDCLMLKKLSEKNANISFLDLYVENFKGEILLEEYLEFIKRYELQKLNEFH